VVSLNVRGAARPGTCGRPLPQLDVEVIDGEIHVSGNAMLGYAGEPQSWSPPRIATGDLGALDADGYLCIHGRRKNLLISSFGRNISPEWVEGELLADGVLAECVVFGDARPHCVALVTPRDPQLADRVIQLTVDRCNAGLPDYARVLGWHRLARPLAGVPGLLTDNGRPRRAAIEARFGDAIAHLYREGAASRHHIARTA
jgi:acyl-coenzyme A synthetase/AMP-(fatty) acid ligase